MDQYLGIDVGGSSVKFGLVNREGELIEKVKTKTNDLRSRGPFIDEFITEIGHKLNDYNHITKVGIGVPGTLSADQRIALEMPNIPEFDGVKIIDLLESRFPKITFHLENDANVAALGEYYFEKVKLPDTFVFITLGTGVGGAAIINGEIFHGADGNGMEIGHIIASNGKTIEQNIGKSGMVRYAKKYLKKHSSKSILNKSHEITSKLIESAGLNDDPVALKVFKKMGKHLGECIVCTARTLDVHTFLIGGGVADNYGNIEKSMNKTIHKHLTPYYTEKIDIRLATLGNNAGIIGAASLCFKD